MLKKLLLSLTLTSALFSINAEAAKAKKPSAQEIAAKEAENIAATIVHGANASPVIAAALKIGTAAKQAIVIDYHTGKVLLEKNADQTMYPSSMTKIMTAYMAFDNLKKGTIKPETTFLVSEKAWKMGGSRMFIDVNSPVSVDDLLKGIVIQSGNDACVALAEGLSGSEDVFAAQMTQKAIEFGCTNTTFKNASGWPDPEHLTTSRDLALIARRVIKDHPEYYDLFSQTDYTYNNIHQDNRNPLLEKGMGCDGLKTGFTEIGQYGLVASATEKDPDGNEKRFIMIINGLPSFKARSLEATKLMTWAMKTFSTQKVAKAGVPLKEVSVKSGAENVVPVSVDQDLHVTIPVVAKSEIKTEIFCENDLCAPITAGQVVGKIVVSAPTYDKPIEANLVALKPVEKAGFFRKIGNSITGIFGGKS